MVDPDLRFVDVTDAYLQTTSTNRRDDVVGRTVSEVFPPLSDEARVATERTYRQVFETEETLTLDEYPYPIMGADGLTVERYWKLTRWLVRTSNGPHVATLGEDVTKLAIVRRLVSSMGGGDLSSSLSALAATIESLRVTLHTDE